MTRLVLIRHGESAWNAEDRLQGQADPPLSDRGREQARRLASTLTAAGRVISSDLVRASETAALAGLEPERLDRRWREIDIGAWTARLNREVARADLEAWRDGRFVPHGAETWLQFSARVGEAVEDLATAGGDWIVITHGGCIRAATAHVTGLDVRAVAGPANCSLTMLELAPRRRLLAYNRTQDGALPRPSDPGA